MATPVRCVWLVAFCLSSAAVAEVHPSGIPTLSSRPGAAYTLYLDFGGFNFAGTWGATGRTPGNVAAFGNASGSFDVAQQESIREVWARVAQKYTPFDINVTTLDPAVAANQASTDALRQAYYDQTPRLMHTVIADGTWYGASGGVSYLGVAPDAWSTAEYNAGAGAGWHTNWIFSNYLAASPKNIGEAAAHENGHGLNLSHQSDYTGTTKIRDYSAGNATYAPIMGNSYGTVRGAWRMGDASDGSAHFLQNDPAVIAANPGLGGYIDDGIGHTLQTATPLPLLGNLVDVSAAQGVIVPLSTTNPDPIGAANYSSDFLSFHTDGTPVTLTLNNGSEFLVAGVADPGATLRSSLTILDGAGNFVAAGIEASSTLSVTFAGTLDAGDYFAVISSYGGATQTLSSAGTTYNLTEYYDMGSYFLSGSGFAVPEPGILLLGAMGVMVLARRRRCPQVSEAV